VAELILDVVRGAVALSCGAFAVVAATHWLVRRGTLPPFHPWTRAVRNASGPLLRPVATAVVRRGGNPQDAAYWLLIVAVAGGLVLVYTVEWLIRYGQATASAFAAGPRGIFAFLLSSVIELLILAVLVRVIGSWFGIGRWTAWMRPFHVATDWLINPLQRVIPPMGGFDISPMAAWLLLIVAREVARGLIGGL
jgi:YggT family protein